MKVIIAAAGTGGHINPGIAIANKIKKENKNAEITFIGTTRGLENDLVPRAGYSLRTIEAYGISRKISIQNFRNMLKTFKGLGEAKKIIKEINPDIVIGTGGYICGPVLLAAAKNKIPTTVHESNAFPGVAVKLLSKKVDTVLVGFKEARGRLPKANKIVVTGNPTKIVSGAALNRTQIKQELGVKNDLPIVLVFGGSQGAKTINETLMEIISKKLNEEYQLIWACGPKQYDIVKEELSSKDININNIQNTKIFPYIHNMEEVMGVSDIVVSRSGAMTITEVAMAGKPAIFVPFPFATENHQEYNAKVLKNVGAAKIILDKDLDVDTLSKTIRDMFGNPEKLKLMGENAKKIAVPNTLDIIYEEIVRLSKKNK
ncbi:MAG: undecaprenyldiphospho-muramoylpentapeptide beta-N-acetylglucosaminyltransferase [Oscillospiraceae bacterium]|nr:undecaprenyldiphospho-muramoylpentapeptide beta-N-acetylglucosaminyltransferase [Oscillospiraceae bacterium]